MMKHKFLYCASAAMAALAMTACSNEMEPAPSTDGPVTITAKMPANINSRAFSDGTQAQTLHYAVYDQGTTKVIFTSENAADPQATYNNDLTFSLSLNLVKGQTYDFVFWADCGTDAPYTFSPEAQSVSIDYTGIKSNEEKRDAFFSIEKGLKVTGAMQKSIQLYRPFAQLNVGTNDLTVAEAAGITLGQTAVTVKDVYSQLNLMSGVASDAKAVTFDFAELPQGENFPVKGYDYLSMNYILTGDQILDGNVNQAQKETKDVTIAIQDKNGKAVNSFDVSAVPFQRNYRTNIYGALLTSTVDYVIEIVPDYNQPDNNVLVNDYKKLLDAIAKGEKDIEIPAGAKIVMPESAQPLELPDGTSLTIDGVVAGPKDNGMFKVPAGATANIKGNGTVQFNYEGDRTMTENNASYVMRAFDIEGTATIEDITITSNNQKAGAMIYVNVGSDVTLNNVVVNTGFRAISTRENSKLVVNGGEFHSTSNNTVKDAANQGVWTYCLMIGGAGSKAELNNVTVTGIQGGIAADVEGEIVLNNCDVSTHHLEGTTWTAFYALYSSRAGNIIVNSGKYAAPSNRYAMLLSDNDITGSGVGYAQLNGGIYSSVAWNNIENKEVPLPAGHKWVDNTDPETAEKYPFRIVTE